MTPSTAAAKGNGRPGPSLVQRSASLIANALERLNLVRYSDATSDELMAAASRYTGLSDWGDQSFRTPLRILVDSIQRHMRLSMLGRRSIRLGLQGTLMRRLQIQANFNTNPSILEVPIRRPLFITGLPRTGTTLLHNLLSQDPACRVLRYWELTNPSPPPSYATYAIDPRIELARSRIRQFDLLSPEFKTIHAFDAQAPEECKFLIRHAFACQTYASQMELPEYEEWLDQQDMIEPYRYYRKQLQLLTWRCAAQHLVLKCTTHLWRLPALLAVFPDACIVNTHRNPLSVVPSMCSLNAHMQFQFTDHVDLARIGAQTLRSLVEGVTRAARFRDTTHSSAFFDVHFGSLMKDPVATVRAIYERFGYEFTASMEQNIRAWLAAHPQHKHGKHDYRLETFGLDRDVVNHEFASYCDQFGVPT